MVDYSQQLPRSPGSALLVPRVKPSVCATTLKTLAADDLGPSDALATPRPLTHGIAEAVAYASETSARRPQRERTERRVASHRRCKWVRCRQGDGVGSLKSCKTIEGGPTP
jgi:hypothetical protein